MEKLVVLQAGNAERISSKEKTLFYIGMRAEAARTGLQLCYESVFDALSGNVTLSDPVLISDSHRDTYWALEKKFPNVRKITLSDVDENFPLISTVRHNIQVISREICEYLSLASRRRLALFAFARKGIYSQTMVQAFVEAAAFYNITFSKDDVYWNTVKLPSCFFDFAKNITKYDAVFCVNDLAARIFITLAAQEGIRVPEDIYVIGRGNSHVSYELSPTITTVKHEEVERGKQVVSLYWYLKKNPLLRKADAFVSHSLVVRDSTANFKPDIVSLTEDSVEEPIYFDSGYNEIMRIEQLLVNCDKTDRKILSMIREGKKTSEVAEALFSSESTVKYRIRNIAATLGVRTRKEVCAFLSPYNLNL